MNLKSMISLYPRLETGEGLVSGALLFVIYCKRFFIKEFAG